MTWLGQPRGTWFSFPTGAGRLSRSQMIFWVCRFWPAAAALEVAGVFLIRSSIRGMRGNRVWRTLCRRFGLSSLRRFRRGCTLGFAPAHLRHDLALHFDLLL